jgi:tol-pal system protein YbgF
MIVLVRQTFALALMLAASAVSTSAWAQESERPGLFDVIFGGSERLAGQRTTAQPAVEHTAQADAPDLLLRLERLESQIRQLTGVIEQLQYRNQQLENQVRRMQEEGESGKGSQRPVGALRLQNAPAAAPAAPVAPMSRRGDAFDPSLNPNAPGAPHILGALPANPAPKPNDMADASHAVPGTSRSNPANPPGSVVATLPPSQTPKDEFDLAYGYVLHRDYPLAEEGFRAFLNKYPNDRLTGDATYWLGESLYQRQRFRDAAEAFLNVSTKFEGNPKAPNALVRLGQSLAALGEKEAACASLGEVLRKFPRSPAGLKQDVEREQKRVRC